MVKYARCNALLSLAIDQSGVGCRYMSKSENEDEVMADMSKHLTEVHEVDPSGLVFNIKALIKTTRS